MAKSKKQSKSSAILSYMADNPDAMPTEVANMLSKDGVTITPQYVSFVKATRKKKAKQKRKAKLSVAHTENGNGSSKPPLLAKDGVTVIWDTTTEAVDIIMSTRALAGRCGGISELRRLVEAMEA